MHAKKGLESSLAILHEQFFTDGISVVAPFPLGWIKLAPRNSTEGISSTDCNFQGLLKNFKILKFKDLQGLSSA